MMRGILQCNICQRPIRDHHEIAPCPEAGEEGRLLTTEVPPTSRPTSDCGPKEGTYGGYVWHLRQKEKACGACLAAKRDYTKSKRKETQDA